MKTETIIVLGMCIIILLIFAFAGGLLLGSMVEDYKQEQKRITQERVDEVLQALDNKQKLGTTTTTTLTTAQTTTTQTIKTTIQTQATSTTTAQTTTRLQTTTTKLGTTTTTLPPFPTTLTLKGSEKIIYGGRTFGYDNYGMDNSGSPVSVLIDVDDKAIQIPVKYTNSTTHNNLNITVMEIHDNYYLVTYIEEV